ncbi:transcriptional regulator, CdaR [Syntrophobotulus glycolicus DSM 8271]|uniref:Transcriptional regulator, CdaR n=1 Tax=Syntrophobotulus glycolicus (strain DSM 8271 / FlGlyR) TaxID=645991 RepID=F0T2J6_SYNGF|nr:helix-turn-helix domain-containing protein [Syntrophobotulus glycolicus]ADY55314.1 transcriptional regulator, CdaR [Syntrophobotulus glycolicus DSM 8271]
MKGFDLSDLPALYSIQNMTGETGLDREMIRIVMPEEPDAEKFFAGIEAGDFVIIPQSVLLCSPDFCRQLLSRDQGRNIAGILVHHRVREKWIGEETLALARSLQTPIFSMGDSADIIDVVYELRQAVNLYSGAHTFDLLDNLMYGVSHNHEMLISRAKFYKYDLLQPHYAFVLKLEMNYSLKKKYTAEEIIRFSENEFKKHLGNVLFTPCSNGLITLLPETFSPQRLEEVVQRIKKEYHINYYGGIGHTYDNLDGFAESIDQAKKIVKILNETYNGKNTIKDFQYMFIYMMIYQMISDPKLEQYYNYTLSTLINYDKANNSQLFKTLRVYLEENQNAVTTAEKLFIHRNTLRNRLVKIEELTRKSLSCLEDRFDLCLAMYIDDIWRSDSKDE